MYILAMCKSKFSNFFVIIVFLFNSLSSAVAGIHGQLLSVDHQLGDQEIHETAMHDRHHEPEILGMAADSMQPAYTLNKSSGCSGDETSVDCTKCGQCCIGAILGSVRIATECFGVSRHLEMTVSPTVKVEFNLYRPPIALH